MVWNSVASGFLLVNAPWEGKVTRNHKLDCGPAVKSALFPTRVNRRRKGRRPGLMAGVDLLSHLGVILDLPHGRVWMRRDQLARIPDRIRSGLHVEFVEIDDIRRLKVVTISPSSPATSLLKLGLRKSMFIEKINGVSANELDLWEVNQYLQGVYGSTLQLEWHQKKEAKIVPFKLR